MTESNVMLLKHTASKELGHKQEGETWKVPWREDHAYSRVVLVVDCMGPVDVALPLIGCLVSGCLPVQRLLVVP